MITSFVQIAEMAKSKKKKTLVVAAADDGELLKAVHHVVSEGIIKAVLVGDMKKMLPLVREANLNEEKIEIFHESDVVYAAETAVQFVNENKDCILMKGMIETSTFLKAVVNKKNGLSCRALMSHVAVMETFSYNKLLILSDCGMIILPDLEQKISIIKNAAIVARALGVNPIKVACISAKEKVDEKMPSTKDAELLKQRWMDRYFDQDIIVDGPMGLDLAVSNESAKRKMYKSSVAGSADILLMPNIETGNAVCKSMSFLAHAEYAGIVVGARVPILFVSRADGFKQKVNTIVLGCIMEYEQ